MAAHELHTEPSQSHVSLVGHAALAVVKGHTRAVDVIEYISEDERIFALVRNTNAARLLSKSPRHAFPFYPRHKFSRRLTPLPPHPSHPCTHS